jgi:hypothetical protein
MVGLPSVGSIPTEGVEYNEFLEHKYKKLLEEHDNKILNTNKVQHNFVK